MGTPPALSLERVSKSFWRGSIELRVLRDATLEVHAGTVVGVQGARGAGKTTLLRVAAGVVTPDAGCVRLDGTDLAALSKRKRLDALRQIVLVDRDPPDLGDLSMLDLVALPLHRTMNAVRASRQAAAMLERAGVSDLAGARWSELSDTDRSLVAIAQGLVRKPRVLVVDDPTAGAMHVIDRERIMSLLRAAAADASDPCVVLMAAPDFAALAGHVDVLCALSRGRLETSASPAGRSGGEVVPFPDSRLA